MDSFVRFFGFCHLSCYYESDEYAQDQFFHAHIYLFLSLIILILTL